MTLQFRVEIFEVFANRADADPVESCDLLGAQPVRDAGEDVQLADGEVRAFPCFVDVRTVSPAYRGGRVDDVQEGQQGLQATSV